MTNNREHLDKLLATFEEWLHVEDPYLLYTLAAMKLSHSMGGDPIWLMLIGPSSDGKSEYLRAFTQEGELSIDDITPKTFVSGVKERPGEEVEQFAEKIANTIWYIYDMSILMSKRAEDRSMILSDMRMIYDGKISKVFGNKQHFEIETPNNTLICGSTPEIDATILEDQVMGTRFITYRINTKDRWGVMQRIDDNEDKMAVMRMALKRSIEEFEKLISKDCYTLSPMENQNLQVMANMTTLLRTSVSMDRSGEPRNLAYSEGPGRLYKQFKKLYKSYRMLGLTEEEGYHAIRKICQDNINPVRVKIIEWLYVNKRVDDDTGGPVPYSTSQISVGTGLGKKTIKSHLHALNLMDMVAYKIVEENYREKDQWFMLDSNLNLLLGEKPNYYVGLGFYYSRYLKK